MENDSDDEYTIPLAYPAPYGAGIKKKGIKFVSAGSLSSSNDTQTRSGEDIANSYLELVLGKSTAKTSTESITTHKASEQDDASKTTIANCQTCNLPLQSAEGVDHHTSLAHQVSLEHIDPPNAIDRTRKGFAYLEAHGWDADSRQGLGAQGAGILRPISAVEKKDKAGVGDRSRSSTPAKSTRTKVQKGPQGLDPKALKQLEKQKDKRGKRLHEMFYTDDAVARYLGEGV